MNNKKSLEIYNRVCDRCNKPFKATGKFCGVCNKCNKSLIRNKNG